MTLYQPALKAKSSDVSGTLRALVARQARSWEENDFGLAADDWHVEGVLVSPGGSWRADELEEEMAKFHRHYSDLTVTIKNIFATADGSKLAVEWDWTVMRRADGVRGTTPDAIMADLKNGKILSWREYFDLSGSVEGG